MTASPALAFVNGHVFTSAASRPFARAVAVGADGRISAVGTDREIADLVGPRTRVVDLAGRMLLPGFQDSHVHPVTGGLGLLGCDLLPLESAEEAFEKVERYASGHPELEWVVGRGWAFEWFPNGTPSAELLDRLVPGRPAYLDVRDGHSAWVNSAALRAAGIDASTPDPPDGRIERNPDGSPQGTLHEGAMALVERVMPAPDDSFLDAALDAGQRHLFSLGITAWHDASITSAYHGAYRRAVASGRLRAQVRGAVWWERERGMDQLDEVLARTEHGEGPYQPRAVKLMLDGVCENFTASMLEPYENAEGSGIDFIDPDELREIVTELDARGRQCHFHAIGDAAVRSALDAVEEARARNGWSDLRHTIAHIQVVDPTDVPRFRSLGVVANCQALWACNDLAMSEMTVPFLGADRARRQYPFGSLRASGATLAMGSDWPVSSADVLEQAAVATRRTPPGEPTAPPFLPDERLSLGETLVAFTAGSAYVNHLEGDRGVIEVGNVADLTVLEADPFTRSHPAGIVVDLTVVGGDVVFERGRS